MTTLLVRRRRPLLVVRPDGSTPGALGLDLAIALARARQAGADVCLLPPPTLCDPALFALVPADRRRVEPRAFHRAWLRARWRARDAAASIGRRAAAGRRSFWLELYRELRRHAGDERLPYPLRARLRTWAQRWFARASAAAEGPTRPIDRRLLERPVPISLPPALEASARSDASALGVAPPRRTVAIDVRTGVDRLHDTVRALAAEGITVVRLGEGGEDRLDGPGVVDLTAAKDRSPALDVFVRQHAEFLVCDTADAQHVAYATGTPCLVLDAVDPVASYPARRDGLYMLAEAVDLDSGVELPLEDRLGPEYLRDPSRYGRRRNTPAEILAAVRELQAGLREGFRDTAAQARFRERVAAACARQAPRGRDAGPAGGGFAGSGRLARVQAERLA
jgi:putative glycosyltransferase (TIGR04372 family)